MVRTPNGGCFVSEFDASQPCRQTAGGGEGGHGISGERVKRGPLWLFGAQR